MEPVQIDYSALYEPITKADRDTYNSRVTYGNMSWETMVVFIFAAGFITVMGLASLMTFVVQYSEYAVLPVGIAFVAVVVVLTIIAHRQYVQRGKDRKISALKFAEKNGFQYTSEADTNGAQPGMIYDEGESRIFKDVMRLTFMDMPVEWGNYQYETGSGRSRNTHWFTYMRITLPRRLPHMVLDSHTNNVKVFGVTLTTGLSDTFNRNQTLALEGDFNNYFTLYCPKEYERDALYVFAPDLMAVMVDEAKDSDVEIVDNYMYVYTVGSFKPNDPSVYRRLVRIAEIVGHKMQSQTDRYIDERVVPAGQATGVSRVIKGEQGIVASGGTRLKKGINWFTTILFFVIFLWQILPWILQLWRSGDR